MNGDNLRDHQDDQLSTSERHAEREKESIQDSLPYDTRIETEPQPLDFNNKTLDLPSNKLRKTLKENNDTILVFKKMTRGISKFLRSYFEINATTCLLREKWVFLLSVFICSSAALGTKNTEKLVPMLFLVSYLCLSYQIIENVLRYRFLRIRNSGAKTVKCMFDMADKALLIIFISILSLQYYGLVSEWLLVLPPVLFLLEILMYHKYFKISQSQDDMKIVTRIVFLLQSLMIFVKMTNIMDSDWKTTLIFLWIYLGMGAFYALFAGALVIALFFVAILSLDTRALMLLKNQALGYIWHISCYLLSAVGLMVLTGVFIKMDSNEDNIIQIGVLYAKNLSLFLMIYSAILFPILKRLNLSFLQSLGLSCRNQVETPKKYKLQKTENENKKVFFSMISPTYFSRLTEEIVQKNESEDFENPPSFKQDEDLCYICEGNASNAILVECGHGGICCECAKQIVEEKDICMECRKPVQAIYKIDPNQLGKIVQAHEIAQIIKI